MDLGKFAACLFQGFGLAALNTDARSVVGCTTQPPILDLDYSCSCILEKGEHNEDDCVGDLNANRFLKTRKP